MYLFITVLFFLFFILAILFIMKAHKEYLRSNYSSNESDCICAFDIDGTITCGLENAAKAVAKCKEKGCKIAINTARPTKWYSDVNLPALGLSVSDFDNDFYHGEPFECSFIDENCFHNSVADTKVKHLRTMAKKWGIEPKRIILFDDLYTNVNKAQNAGFSIIHANDGGIPNNAVEKIDKILS